MIDDGQFGGSQQKAAWIDAAVPNPARIADFLNGGRNNFDADRRTAQTMLSLAPAIAAIVPFVLAFHQRAVRFLALEAGVRQFIDVGTGLPGAETGRDLVQSIDPACRVVHVDNDPMVLTHLRAFARSTSPGAFAALDGKLTDPDGLLAGAAETLDFRRPAALLVPSSLPFIASAERAAAAAVHPAGGAPGRELPRALPRGERPRSGGRGRRRLLEQNLGPAFHPALAVRGGRLHRRARCHCARPGPGQRMAPRIRRPRPWPAGARLCGGGEEKALSRRRQSEPRSVRNQRHLNSRALIFERSRATLAGADKPGHPKETPWASGSSVE